ncbi:DUF6099 family protein [Streptomyces sp. ICBB 8177]|uniref:DUF6099 family protein n=1 Tax=Streptomyces sp. ICBB 8177 TaxID=563922 RepID=UPI0018EE79AD|nr:DUF6099 family protein [Streptomyces sp. ICBB 8177]
MSTTARPSTEIDSGLRSGLSSFTLSDEGPERTRGNDQAGGIEMDALRLITVTRHALARARDAEEVIAEAWQAQALVEAIAVRLAVPGDAPPRMRGGPARAVALTGVREPPTALRALLALTADVVVALVAVACATEEENVYWQCIEAMDAVDEARDRVRSLLTRYGSDPPSSPDPGDEPPQPDSAPKPKGAPP